MGLRQPWLVRHAMPRRQLSLVGNAFHRDLPLGLTRLQQLKNLALTERQALEWPGLPLLPRLAAVYIAADKQQDHHMAHHQLPTGKQLRRLLREILLPLRQVGPGCH